jgi:hypothetical protein
MTKGFLISIKSEHGHTQCPNISRRIHILGPKYLFRRVETDSPLLHLGIEAGVVKHRKIPIDELNLVELEIEPHRVHHYIAHLNVVVNDTRPVDLVHLPQHLIEKERRLLTVELQVSEDDRLFVRKNSNRMILSVFLRTFINSLAVFGPSHRVIQLLHQKTFPPKLFRSFLKIAFKNFPLAARHVLNKKNLARASGIDEGVKVVIIVGVVEIDFWSDNWVRHVPLGVIWKSLD